MTESKIFYFNLLSGNTFNINCDLNISKKNIVYNIFNLVYNILKQDNPFLLIHEINLIFNNNETPIIIKYYDVSSHKLFNYDIINYDIILKHNYKFKYYYINSNKKDNYYLVNISPSIKNIKDIIKQIWNTILNSDKEYEISICDKCTNTIYYSAHLSTEEYVFYNDKHSEYDDGITCYITDYKNFTDLSDNVDEIQDFINNTIFSINIKEIDYSYFDFILEDE
jgi:hypothetical protein